MVVRLGVARRGGKRAVERAARGPSRYVGVVGCHLALPEPAAGPQVECDHGVGGIRSGRALGRVMLIVPLVCRSAL